LTLYLDTSVVVPLFVTDPFSRRAEKRMRDALPIVGVSDFCLAEFASAIANRVRRGALEERQARVAFSELDSWLAGKPQRINMTSADLAAAAGLMRRLDLPLKTGDAIHLAIVRRLGLTLATFDRQMAECARSLGIDMPAG
jgi:uncharacterized protein